MHGVHDTIPMRLGRSQRKQLANPISRHARRHRLELAANLGGRLGFHVKCIVMRGAALLEDDDARLCSSAAMILQCPALRAALPERGERETTAPERAELDDTATTDSHG